MTMDKNKIDVTPDLKRLEEIRERLLDFTLSGDPKVKRAYNRFVKNMFKNFVQIRIDMDKADLILERLERGEVPNNENK